MATYSKKQTQKLLQNMVSRLRLPFEIYSFGPVYQDLKAQRRWINPNRLGHETLASLYAEFRSHVPEGRFNIVVYNEHDDQGGAIIDTNMLDKVIDYTVVVKENKVARLADWVKNKQFIRSPFWEADGAILQKILATRLDQSEIFIIDNIADYAFANEKTLWDIKEFPGLIPAAGQLWFEYRATKRMRDTKLVTMDSQFIGVDIEVLPPEAYQWLRKLRSENNETVPDVDEQISRVLNLSLFMGGRNDYGKDLAAGPFAVCIMAIGKTNRVLTEPFWFADKLPAEGLDEWRSKISLLFVPALLSLSLMNFKDVKPVADNPTSLVSQSYQQRNKVSLIKRKALDIEPAQKVLKEVGKAETVGLQQALLACQQHLTEPAEVFSKHNGVFWWDNISRHKPQTQNAAENQQGAESDKDAAEKNDQSRGTNG